MEHKATFWKGISAGFLAGMAVAAALRYTPFEKFITNLSTLDGKLDASLGKLEVKLGAESKPVTPSTYPPPRTVPPTAFAQTPAATAVATPTTLPATARADFFQEQLVKAEWVEAEPLEDSAAPSTLAAARTGAVASFLRSGAANGRAAAARYPVPGLDLPRPDHIDLTRPIGTGQRNFDLGSAG
jgi:hypothetical protein